jgi:regulatory protein
MKVRLKKYNNDEAYRKLMQYCSYQDRCHKEIKDKLYEWGFDSEDTGKLIIKLLEDKYLNEERFARSFVRGKFNYKHWGRQKIRQELKKKGITDNLIRIALQEINDRDYQSTLRKLIISKQKQLKEKSARIRDYKTIQFLITKGYEIEVIKENLNSEESE